MRRHVSGRDNKMMSGLSHDSNCAARIKYMNTKHGRMRSKNPSPARRRSSSDPWVEPYPAGACASGRVLHRFDHVTVAVTGATFAMKVTCAVCPMRLTCAGPDPSRIVMTD